MPLPARAIALSLVANWVASENITGLVGAVACGHAIPAILLDPLGAAACLAALGLLLAPFAGRFSTFSEVVVDRYGVAVGGAATLLSLIGSLLWAGAQYRAILELVHSVEVVPKHVLEPSVIIGLLSWTLLGGLVADVWLDSLSMLVVAPSMSAVAIYAISQTPAAAYAAEASHAAGALLTARSANTFAVGLLGNLFTEELAGRVLLAGSPREARAASFAACGLFGVLGLAPAALGIWARSAPGVLTGEGGESLCAEGGQDRILSASLRALLPPGLQAAQKAMLAILILECLNTVDTSILMCAQVMERQLSRTRALSKARWLQTGTVVVSLALVVGVSRLGDSVWGLAEQAVAAVGAPLAVLSFFLPRRGAADRGAASAALMASQAAYLGLAWRRGDEGAPFLLAVAAGVAAYALVQVTRRRCG